MELVLRYKHSGIKLCTFIPFINWWFLKESICIFKNVPFILEGRLFGIFVVWNCLLTNLWNIYSFQALRVAKSYVLCIHFFLFNYWLTFLDGISTNFLLMFSEFELLQQWLLLSLCHCTVFVEVFLWNCIYYILYS